MSEASPIDRQPIPAWQFSLGGILLVITLIAVCLALLRQAPCSGVLLTLICVPAALRTAMTVRHYARRGERMTIYEKLADFVLSFFMVLWIEVMAGFTGVAAAVFLAVPLTLLFDANVALGLACIPGAAIGLAALVGLMWMLRPGLP